jgi:LysM repeat protein
MDTERIIRNLRLQLLVERIAFAVITLTLVTVWAFGHFGDGPSFILVNNRPVACLNSAGEAEVVLSQVKCDAGCNPAEVKFAQDVRVARAPRNSNPVSRERAVSAVRNAVCPMVSRWAIIVNGRAAVALPDEKTAGDALEMAKMKFGSMVKNLAEEPQFKEDVKVGVACVPVTLYRGTAEQAYETLFAKTQTKTSNESYTVKNGDVAVLVAKRHGMDIGDLEKLNPGVNLARLQIGDAIRISAVREAGPKLTVVVRDQQERTESMPAPVQKVSSARIYQGESVQLAPGKPGLRKVKVADIYENGRKTGTEIVSEEIICEPQPKRVALGMKIRHR